MHISPLEQLRLEYQNRVLRNPKYSLRAFAKKLGISPGALSELLTGQRRLTPALAGRIAPALGWPEERQQRFLSEVLAEGVVAATPVDPIPWWHSSRFVGREREMASLGTLAAGGSVALVGPEGVGKTALATRFCASEGVRERWPDGIVWLQVGPRVDRTDLLGRLGRSIGALTDGNQRSPSEAQRATVNARLAELRLLLVLDDVWDHDSLWDFSGAAESGTSILLTTRNSQLRGACNGSVALDDFSPPELALLLQDLPRSVQEFMHAYPARRPGTLVPLVHFLAATGNGVGPRPELLRAFSDGNLALSRLLAHLPGTEPLASLAPVVVQNLEIFPASPATFSAEAFFSVCLATPTDLEVLISTGVLRRTDGGRLCKVLPLVPAHGIKVARKPFVEFHSRLVQENKGRFDHLRQEEPNLTAAFAHAVDLGQVKDAAAFADALAALWVFDGCRGKATLFLTEAEHAVRASLTGAARNFLLARLCLVRARTRQKWGCEAEVVSALEQAVDLAGGNQAPEIEILATLLLASRVDAGKHAELLSVAQKHLRKCPANPALQATLALEKGRALLFAGKPAAARAMLRKATRLGQMANDFYSEYAALMTLIAFCSRDGSPARVERDYLGRAEESVRRHRQDSSLPDLHLRRAYLEFNLADFPAAAAHLHELLERARAVGNHGWLAQGLAVLAAMHFLQGKPALAEVAYEQMCEELALVSDPILEVFCLTMIVGARIWTGHLAGTARLVDRCFEVSERADVEPYRVSHVLLWKTALLRKSGQCADAMQCLDEADRLMAGSGFAPTEHSMNVTERTHLALHCGELEEALALARSALRLPMGPIEKALAHGLLGECFHASGDLADAKAEFMRANRLMRRHGCCIEVSVPSRGKNPDG